MPDPTVIAGFSPGLLAGVFSLAGVVIAGLVTLVVLLLKREYRRHEAYMTKLDASAKAQADKLEMMARAQMDKDAILLERLSVTNERLKARENADTLLERRLGEGTQTFRELRDGIAGSIQAQSKLSEELYARQAKFEQEAHTRQLSFAGQWQTTLVDLANRFVGQAALDEYRTRHEQDHSRVEVRLSRQEELMEKMEQTVHGIDKKLEGGIQTIAALLAKHVTVGEQKPNGKC
jgi:hypothetical protein